MIERLLSDAIKLIIYVGSVVILYIFLFVGLLQITSCISNCCLLRELVNGSISSDNDMAVYVIAAATLDFALLTILQQHFTRQQDRTLNFPDICIKECKLIISEEKIVDEIMGMDSVKGKYMIKISFDKTFPVYYIPTIHKAWVIQKKISEKNEQFDLEVLSNFLTQNEECTTWNIQVDNQKCIKDTVERSQIENIQALEFVYDISWENQLLPFFSRVLSKIYMRMVICLEDTGVSDATDLSGAKECIIKVKNLKIKQPSIWHQSFN